MVSYCLSSKNDVPRSKGMVRDPRVLLHLAQLLGPDRYPVVGR
jgi:hypothetical protein